MCHSVVYNYKNNNRQVSFDQLHAKLPILMRNGHVALTPWGRRQHDTSNLPLGGWAQLDEIYLGKWDSFFPRPVKLPIQAFLARDIEDQAKWFHLPCDKWIQGLLAHSQAEKRVYIVTLTPNEDSLFLRWPRILLG